MILYLDTSSMVKLYVEEQESAQVEMLVKSSGTTATSIVAYAEARAAFARRHRERSIAPEEYDRIKKAFNQDWANFFVLFTNREMIRMAGDLAEKHALRGFDAIHLASALMLQQETSIPILFSCFDTNLEKAAAFEGLCPEK